MKNLALVVTMGLSFQAFAAIDSTYFATLDVKSIHDQEKANEKKVKHLALQFLIQYL